MNAASHCAQGGFVPASRVWHRARASEEPCLRGRGDGREIIHTAAHEKYKAVPSSAAERSFQRR